MKKNLNFYEKINNVSIERQVEDVYNEGISFYFKKDDGLPIEITYPYSCDGLIETKTLSNKLLKLLMEFKFNNDMSNNVIRAKILIQALFYMKRFEMDGKILPNVLLIGDKNECFVLHTNSLIKYLDYDVDWKQSPSTAAQNNPDMIIDIAADKDINPFVFVINESFSFKVVATKIVELADDVVRYVHVTEHNISRIFDYFSERVIKNKNKISANDLVAIFIGIITNGDNYYTHPKNKNMLVTPFGEITINNGALDSFLKYFNRKYTPQEKMCFTQISDRLIEDTDRRNKGEFYTPTLFVDYAHSMIEKELGEKWKDEYVVFDCCCGTLNLTRDYRFKELYCSTLENAELEIGSRYNPEATKFQFDFLNDYIPMPNELIERLTKIPDGLLNAFKENKPIVFFLNPPYGKATGYGDGGKIESGTSDTNVKEQMKRENIEGSELLKQFLWKIADIKRAYNLTKCYVACFTNPSWICKEQSINFRKMFFDNFKYKNGVYFCAGEFADVSSAWGITFNIWESGIQENRNNFLHTLITNDIGEIKECGTKFLYNFDNQNIITHSQFINKNLSKKHKEHIVYCKDIKTMEFTSEVCNVFDDYICSINSQGGDVQNNKFTCIRSVYPKSGCGRLQLTKNNIFECSVVQAIRNIIETNWMSDKDLYNMNVEISEDFKNDSFVYALFSNYCCSIKLSSKDVLKNELFWMSKNDIQQLANDNGNDECYNDVHTSDDRYAYKLLNSITLSNEAQAVLDKAIDIVIKTFKYRVLFNQEHPEFQINNWDCGWYQIKALAKEYAKNELKDFKLLFNNLSNKMKPMIYELGFLQK